MISRDFETYVDQLDKNTAIIQNLVNGITPEQATWRPNPPETRWAVVETIGILIGERNKSLAWLRGLENPDLDTLHSGLGFKGKPLRAGDVLVGWVAHDLFHIRQLSLLRWEVLCRWSKPCSPEYSGFQA